MSPKAFRSSPVRNSEESSAEESYDESDGHVVEMEFQVHFGDLVCALEFPTFPTFDDLKLAIHVKFPEVPPANQRILIMADKHPDGRRKVEVRSLDPYVDQQRQCPDLLTFVLWVEDSHAHEVMSITILPLEEPDIDDMVITFTLGQTVGYVKTYYMIASGRNGVTLYLQGGESGEFGEGSERDLPVDFGSPWLFTDDTATLQGQGISSGSVLVANLFNQDD
jgi:hypothetical protein